MKYYVSFVLLILTIACSPKEKNLEPLHIAHGIEGKKLDSLLTPYILELRNLTSNEAGLAIGVTKGQQTIYGRCFGYSNINQKELVDFNTRFHIASVSKPFVAMAITKLIEQEMLRLDDKIVDIIPEFNMPDHRYNLITVKHLLTHTSGIPANISPDDWTKPSFGEKALDENLISIQDHNLQFEPGTSFSYSNAGFDLLGIVIQRLSDMPFSSFVSKEILEPTGMTQSSYNKDGENLPSNWADAHSFSVETQKWNPYPYNEKLFPSSGLVTSLNDMLKWTKLHLGKGKINGRTIISEKYFNLMIEPHHQTPWGDQIGLSWFLQSYLDRPIIMHQGQDTGFECLVYVFPKQDISIIVMANRDFSRIARIINAAAEVLFDEKIKPYSVSAKYKFAESYKSDGIEKAISTWSELRRDTSDIYYSDDDDILTTGAILENAGQWTQTKEVLEFYNNLNQRSTYSWRLLGNAYLNLGDTATALKHYNQCLEINPEYTKAQVAIDKISNKN